MGEACNRYFRGVMIPAASLHFFHVQLTADDYVALNFQLWQKRPATRRTFWLLGAAALLLLVSVGLDVARHGTVSNRATLAFLAVAALYGLFRRQLTRYLLRRGFRVQPAVDYILTPTDIRVRSEQRQVSVAWNQVREAVWIGPHWMLLFPKAPASACYYLDLRRLEAPATAAEVQQLVTRHGVPQHHL